MKKKKLNKILTHQARGKRYFIEISRKDALTESERVDFENPNVIGSISLKGAAIDDLTLKNYNVELEGNENNSLGPRNIKEGYLIESDL